MQRQLRQDCHAVTRNRAVYFLARKTSRVFLCSMLAMNITLLVAFWVLPHVTSAAANPQSASSVVVQKQQLSQDLADLREQAEAGNAPAQDALGTKYLVGEGVTENKEEAVKWFRKSARQGNASAMYHLGAAYYNGDGVPISDSLSYAWFRVAEEGGNVNAKEAVQRAESELKPETITAGLDKIAEMYEPDGSLPENQAEAARWWSMAAERGDEDAKLKLAVKMVNGQGVQRDPAKGRHICDQAAKSNNPRAEYCLGYIYEKGLGVKPDLKKAREWYEPAAAVGLTQAMTALAPMEIAGEGGKVDRVDAFLLYARLAEAKNEGALRSLARLRKELTPKEWARLQQPLRHLRIDPVKLDHILQGIDSK